MNLQSITLALCEHFLANFSTCPVAMENEKLDNEPTWVRVQVAELPSSAQRTLGPKPFRKFQRDCEVRVQVFTPVEGRVDGEGGVDAGLAIAEQVRSIFQGETISAAKFHGPTIGREKVDFATGRWFVLLVKCPFYFQETA